MTNKLIGGSVIVLALLVLVALFRPPVIERTVEQVTNDLGAQSVAVTDGNCIIDPALGGHLCVAAQPFQAATTTVCAVQSPTNATSTLNLPGSGLNITTGTSTATRIWITKSSTRFGATTTTQFNTATLAANLKGFITATTSLNGGVAQSAGGTVSTDLPLVFAPGTWLRFEIADGKVNGSGFAGNGSCKTTFIY